MKKVINCFKEDNPVIQKKLRRVSIDEGMEIAKELFEILNKRKDGIGLAANQVGIDAAVAVVNVTTPYILINPEIVEAWDEIPFYEWIFSGVDKGESGKGSWEDDEVENDRELRTLEAVCIQHEIDHLNGIRCLDKAVDTTIRVEKKPGRNEPCHCGSGKKFKKCCINK